MWIRRSVGVFLLLSLQTTQSYANMDAKAVSSSIAKFSTKFLNELDKSKNVVSSPLSVEMVLGLLALGTEDPAHQELLTSLGIPDDDAIRTSFSIVSSKLRATKGVTLDVANKVYVKEGDWALNSKLEEDAVKVFDAGIEKINFDDGAAAANTINKWVESKTNEKIKDLLTPDSLNEDSRVVFVNALYFKGTWQNQFDPMNTIDQPFHIDNEKTIDIPMMYKEDDYVYGESEALGAQLLRIFYKAKEASMLIVLPNEITGLDGVLKKLADGHDLLEELSNMHSTKVQVTLPKFKIETEIDLLEVLPKLGINSIFALGNNGLTKILSNPEPLSVSKAVQKAFIEVNEEGAEAAAATAMGIMLCSAMIGEPPTPRFEADRPFLVVILIGDDMYFVATHRGQ